MTYRPLILALFGFCTACNVENKFHNLQDPIAPGECDPELLSREVPDEERPIAVCDASMLEMLPIYDETDLLGAESYDPNGYELIEYEWNMVEQPTGSASILGAGDANRYSFNPDMAGEYVFELVVTNDRCVQSDPCQLTIKAIPGADMWIEMSWSQANDDMDLHLVADNAPYESDGDCYYGNCVTDDWGGLNWGDPGRSVDDPSLDLDDIEGTGPENINIIEPEEGSYKVVVHDYPGSVFHESNQVNVRIYLGGELIYEESKNISGEDSYTPFAEISWPEMSITPL
jgi:hypothetical protein